MHGCGAWRSPIGRSPAILAPVAPATMRGMTPTPSPAARDWSAGYAGPVHAPRGTDRRCATWGLEAPFRMLLNNLDPEVAEDPARLVVYGGTGRAARSWEDVRAILATLERMKPDETLC